MNTTQTLRNEHTLDSLGQLIDQMEPVHLQDLTVEPNGYGNLAFQFESNNYAVSGLIELDGKMILVTYTGLTDLDEFRAEEDPELEIGGEWLNRMGDTFAVHVARYADINKLIPDRTKTLYLPNL